MVRDWELGAFRGLSDLSGGMDLCLSEPVQGFEAVKNLVPTLRAKGYHPLAQGFAPGLLTLHLRSRVCPASAGRRPSLRVQRLASLGVESLPACRIRAILSLLAG